MTSSSRITTIVAGLACLAAALPRAATAQSPYLGREPGSAIWVEFLYPVWDDVQGYSAYLLNAGARFGIGSATTLVVEVPMATSSDDSPFADDGFLAGNPYIGVRQRYGSTSAELGVRPSLVGDDAPVSTALGGVMADFDRFEAWLPSTWSFRGDLGYETTTEAGFRMSLGAGPTVMKPDEGDTELLVDYRAGVGYAIPGVVLMAWFTGRWLATSDGADFGQASSHQLTLSGTGGRGRLRPAAYIRVPLDEDLDFLKMALGVGLTYGF